jgi:hypothetical protein
VRKNAAWASANGAGRRVPKVLAQDTSLPSFTHIGDFGTDDITVVKAYRVYTASSPLSYAILDRPRPDQATIRQVEDGIPMLIHLADTAADATFKAPQLWRSVSCTLTARPTVCGVANSLRTCAPRALRIQN